MSTVNILNLEKIGVKEVEVESLYIGGDSFLISGSPKDYKFEKLKDHKFQKFFNEMVNNPEKNIEDLLYYKAQAQSIHRSEGRLYTEGEVRLITERNLELLRSIKDNGYSAKCGERLFFNTKGLPDGAVTALVYKNKTLIISGYHRSSIALLLGIKKIPIILFKRKNGLSG